MIRNTAPDYVTVPPPAYVERAPVRDVLDEAHQLIFQRALRNVLSTDIVETTFAQIIDRLPLASVALTIRGIEFYEAIINHKALDPEAFLKVKALLRDFDIASLELQVEVLERYQRNTASSKASRLHLIELVVIAIHRIAIQVYKIGTPLKERGLQEDQLCYSSDRYKMRYYPTPFVLRQYADPKQYREEGIAELPGYWAEDQIFGGVVVFDRGNGTELITV
ncbi:hypothetical protein VMCG_04792 [Cytospora schulzeri]|uniref:Uncharacterized protein n=1 Tax=Cytospora schulzeri TaxID=448051 RepID=A0A423WMG9_9PEZI|nr:hypothetical protein VMCG_04792 [Valsa malicola]